MDAMNGTTTIRKNAPYGQKWGNNGLEDNSYEQEIIQLVLTMRYNEHLSHAKIARKLVEMGKQSRSGAPVKRHNVAYIIKNVLPRERGVTESKGAVGRGIHYGRMWTGSNVVVENSYEQNLISDAIELRRKNMSYSKIAQELATRGYVNRAGYPVSETNVSYWFRKSIPAMMKEKNNEKVGETLQMA